MTGIKRSIGAVIAFGTWAAVSSWALGGCTGFAANSTVRVMNEAAPAIQMQADPGIAEGALPYSIAQMEGLLLVIPGNRDLRINAARAYGSYGFGFLEDRMEVAEINNDERATEHYRERASAAYVRGKALGLEQMNRDEDGDGGPMAAYRGGVDRWNAYLRRFDEAEDVPVLFWTAYNWARYINLHKDDVDAIADLPFAIALFERALAVDPGFNFHAPHAAMASYHAGRAPGLGGQPQTALRHFEAAINGTQRRFLTYQVMMARTYAVQVQDRALFRRLLHEVICAGDVWPEQRLANVLAKRRALRYAAQLNDLFEAPEGGAEEPDIASCDAPAAPSSGEGEGSGAATPEAASAPSEGAPAEGASSGETPAQPSGQP